MSFHTIILVGNLGRDPEMRYTPGGQAVTSFSVAVNDNYTNNAGEKIDRTLWFRITTWGKQAETCNQYLKKGKKVLVEGRMVVDPATGGPRIWTRQDGTNAASFEVSASTVRFLSSRSEGDTVEQGGELAGESSTDEEIPF
jgi:single-strand DNA-binding protein